MQIHKISVVLVGAIISSLIIMVVFDKRKFIKLKVFMSYIRERCLPALER
jgi:hypothetical protein